MSTETKPRTCCETHNNTCKFGRQHRWSIGWFGGPKSGVGIGTEGWHESMICSDCMGICVADLEEDVDAGRCWSNGEDGIHEYGRCKLPMNHEADVHEDEEGFRWTW